MKCYFWDDVVRNTFWDEVKGIVDPGSIGSPESQKSYTRTKFQYSVSGNDCCTTGVYIGVFRVVVRY